MAYKRESQQRKKVEPLTEDQISVFIEGEKVEQLLHAYTFNKPGSVKQLRVDLDGYEHNEKHATIEVTIERVREKDKLVKARKAIPGANNVGNFKVGSGDRLLVRLIPGAEAFSIKGAWVSYVYVR